MDPLESFLVALVAAVVKAVTPTVVQQIQQPSTAQDGFSDPALQNRVRHEISDPGDSAD